MKSTPSQRSATLGGGADEALLDLVQRQSFGYFWDFAHPESGMARDRGRSDGTVEKDLLAVGGTGFGIMATIVAVERGWIPREDAVDRLLKIWIILARRIATMACFRIISTAPQARNLALWQDNAGGDIVETSYLVAGFLCARQYFNGNGAQNANCALASRAFGKM